MPALAALSLSHFVLASRLFHLYLYASLDVRFFAGCSEATGSITGLAFTRAWIDQTMSCGKADETSLARLCELVQQVLHLELVQQGTIT